jgi:hypothetical protein
VLTDQNIEAELSYAYLHAVASRAGLICEWGGRHTDAAGIDATLRVHGRLAVDSVLTGFTVDVQLKATSSAPKESHGRYSHFLEIKNYNDLRSTTVTAPQLLIVLFLPADPAEWLTHSDERLVSCRCAYWQSLRGAVESTNKTGQTVHIPKSHVVSEQGLRTLMTRFSRREVINYEG